VEILGEQREVEADPELASEVNELGAVRDGDVAEAGRRVELRRVDELSVMALVSPSRTS
jgi:hypothetical protein